MQMFQKDVFRTGAVIGASGFIMDWKIEWFYYYRILQILQFYIFMAFKCQSEDSIQVMWALWTNQRPVSGHVISLWSVIYLKKGK